MSLAQRVLLEQAHGIGGLVLQVEKMMATCWFVFHSGWPEGLLLRVLVLAMLVVRRFFQHLMLCCAATLNSSLAKIAGRFA